MSARGDLLAWAEAGLLLLAGLTFGAIAAGWEGALLGALAGAGLGALRMRRGRARQARRRAAESAPFPQIGRAHV